MVIKISRKHDYCNITGVPSVYMVTIQNGLKGIIRMRRMVPSLLCMILVFAMCSCSIVTRNPSTDSKPQYGSFTVNKSSSYDGKYYALISEDEQMIVITLYSSDDNEVFSFAPCRKSDFWGICWENDSYNLWIQSGDIGIKCYGMADEVWSFDDDALRPDYIISKYDK